MKIVKKLFQLFNAREKRNVAVLLVLMLFSAFFETIGIGLIVPFIGIVMNPSSIQKQVFLKNIYHTFHFSSTTSFLVATTVLLTCIFIFKNIYLIFYYSLQYKFINNQRISKKQTLLKVYLQKPYEFYLQRNSAELLRNVNSEVDRVFEYVMVPLFAMTIELLVVSCILLLLLVMDPITTIFSIVLLSATVLIFFKVFRHKIGELGIVQQKTNEQMIKWINQGLGANKEVKVAAKESFFIRAFSYYSKQYANAERYFQMVLQIPRMFVETIVIVTVLSMILLIIVREGEATNLISTMGLFAMAAFRLMPSINRIMNSITSIKYHIPALNVIFDDLIEGRNINLVEYEAVSVSERMFHSEIECQNVYYRYPNQKEWTLQNVSLQIPIGKSIAFIGASGAGKTTIVDILLGLLEPEKGKVLVDGKELVEQLPIWKKRIGYIPQAIYLSDDSIRRNVAFGVDEEEIDDVAVWRALEDAQLKDFVEKMPAGLDTFVGERGVRLSGGQRQRIGIARALYHDPEILFLDEATSALDNETEKEIIKSIDRLKGHKTLIIIAHRLSTIENCDIIFKMDSGKLVSTTICDE